MKLERLDPRKEKILASVVELYTETEKPVGSVAVARRARLGVSAATIRNEMRVLEAQGLIDQPHTSAGRVPTVKGYRYYVDYLLREQSLPRSWSATVHRLFAHRTGKIEELLQTISRFVSDAIQQAAVVVGPYPEDETLRDVHLSLLSDELVLVSLVTSSGRAVAKSLSLNRPLSPRAAERAYRACRSLRGTPILSVARAFESLRGSVGDDPGLREETFHLFGVIASEFADVQRFPIPYFVGGTSWVARKWPTNEWHDFEEFLRALEEQQPVISALKLLSGGGSVSVFIGSENPSRLLRSCSVVAGSIVADSKVVGSVGVVGPTRMNYARVMPVVREISSRIGDWLVAAYG